MNKILKVFRLPLLLTYMIASFTACNKDLEQLAGDSIIPPTGISLSTKLSTTSSDSLFNRLVIRAGLNSVLADSTKSITLFVPDNNAMKAFINAISGGAVPLNAPDAVFSGFITTKIPSATAAAIVSYNMIPQSVKTDGFGTSFSNFQYPTFLNPAPSVSALLRLTTFLSAQNGAWVNNVPLTGANDASAIGIIHHTAAVVTPPNDTLWSRIKKDANLTYFKAAIERADSGVAPGTRLQDYLSLPIGPNFTVFAPVDSAFKATLTGAIAQALIAKGMDPATALATATALASSPTVFTNPLVTPVLTVQLVQGVVYYHILGTRAFTNNFPTSATFVPTLLNSAIANHPGVSLSVTMGAPFATAATVKGVGNASAANIYINNSPLLPPPFGTSDQHYLNGVLHKINMVLLPQ